MLAKSPTAPPPAMTFAFADNKAVRLAAGTKCPHCDRGLHATSVTVDRNHVRMICSACHGDVLVVEDAP